LEEGLFCADDLTDEERRILEEYAAANDADAADTGDTKGLLKRCSVVEASRRYVGKETDRRWEQGEDLSLVEFTSFEYQQSKQVVAGEDIKAEILKIGIRKLERNTGVSHHTLDKILKGEHVRRKTLAKIMKQVQPHREQAKLDIDDQRKT
jgi:hypothetical protein